MSTQTSVFTPLNTNVTLGRDWLIQMGRGAAKNNVLILYCMGLSRHILQSLEIAQVNIARASDDYDNMVEHGMLKLGLKFLVLFQFGFVLYFHAS